MSLITSDMLWKLEQAKVARQLDRMLRQTLAGREWLALRALLFTTAGLAVCALGVALWG